MLFGIVFISTTTCVLHELLQIGSHLNYVSVYKSLFSDGVVLVCQNLVQSNRYAINVNPSLVSSITQLLSFARGSIVSRRTQTETDCNNGLHNYAPLGKC